MYTRNEISAALKAFANWTTSGDESGRVTAEMLEAGELEVVDIVDGEFVLRTRAAPLGGTCTKKEEGPGRPV